VSDRCFSIGMKILLSCLLISCSGNNAINQPVEEEFDEIKVMTYNILYSTTNDATLKVLRETDADIIGLQEISTNRLTDLAQRLNYWHYSFPKTTANGGDEDTGILSRFPITRTLTNGVVMKVNPTLEVAIFTVHLSPYPYEPYDFRDKKITTPEQAIASASSKRLPEIQPVLKEINELRIENIPIFLTGDFNEPSRLDWTTITATSNMHFSKVVEWPVSKSILTSGMNDAYRSKFSNPANFPGNTWTTIKNSNEVYDRIDFIYQTNETTFTLNDIRLVGGVGDTAGITVTGYPSDHYAVIATYSLKP
jgi:endonuclease/exonuclease/phosphatase family metal-dependent hydrolase